ncbi:MAG: hypothetical protein QNJ51_27530 [Calothrix sp. MO_167.B12]|nr:hypothetical protein [Calothrix sp. MO_167.B12]
MEIKNNKVVMDKEEFAINSLYRGVALDLLAHVTEISLEELHTKIYSKAQQQFEELKNAQMVDELVKKHLL